MKSHVAKRSVLIAGHKTSVSLEDAFWTVLQDAARQSGQTLGALVSAVDDGRPAGANLSSMLRLFALDYVQRPAGGPAAEQARAA